ncbi:MAG: hypothetical protein Q3X95_03340 [Duodenibacillus sp.]|nr:hypothetical protein [Duodenibacillus sp.]
MTYATFIRNRNQRLEQAFQAIEDAKRILSELEQMTVRSAEGNLPDIGETAHLTHGLRNAVDQILVGIVESVMLPDGQEAA